MKKGEIVPADRFWKSYADLKKWVS
jgi:hypothetical protein